MNDIRDKYGRSFETLRISLTNACNFACTYCVNGESIKKLSHNLHYTELAEIVMHLNDLLHFKTVRLTGGEPLLFKELVPFIKILSSNGIEDITLTTNGFLLKQKAAEIAEAGIKGINISLDALDRDIFFLMTRRNSLREVIEGIQAAAGSGISIKLNAVILRTVNENQVVPLLDYAISMNIRLRYLELMKMGHLHSGNFRQYFFPVKEILSAISSKYSIVSSYREPSATARYRVLDSGAEFGIIANESEPFCLDCNRLRLDSSGNIFGCLSENKSEYIPDIISNEKLLKEKLKTALSYKQPLKFKGSSLKMIGVGG